MIGNNSSVWDGIENAEVYERGRYVEPNFSGTVRITKTEYKVTRAKGTAFIVEMEVEESNLDAHPVGSKISWYQSLNDKDIAFSSILEWAAACVGLHKHNKDEIAKLKVVNPQTGKSLIRELLSDATEKPTDNDFIDVRLRLQTVPTKTRKNTDFTRYEFSPAA